MVRNYLKIAFRNLLKNKSYSLLNIFGLAIGITCASFIFLWVEDELDFDAFIEDKEEVFYLPTNQKYDGKWNTFYSTPGPLAKALKEEVPGVAFAAATTSQRLLFSLGEHNISRSGRYAESDIFDIFNLNFIEGNASTAFKNREGIVLTQEVSELLFDKNETALGKTIIGNNNINYVVTGVIENLPVNTTFTFSWLAPFERFSEGKEWTKSYGNNFADTFVKLDPQANVALVNEKVKAILEAKSEWKDIHAFLHSSKDWHLRSKFKEGKIAGGRIAHVRLFTLIALIILVIACINFMNLATARSEKRANEVGVRKALGSGRFRLISQFILEALLLSVIATMVSILLIVVLLPQFNNLVNKELVLGLGKPLHFFALLGVTLVCGLFSGLYPAFYLSSFKPVDVLKGIKKTGNGANFIRKGLVISQFTISIVFIICTILVYQQIQHAKNRDVGYSKEQIISINTNTELIKNFSVIKEDLIKTGVVEDIALCNTSILWGGNNGSGLEWPGGTNTDDYLISFRYITPNFFDTMKMKIIEGRGFFNNPDKDSTHVMISASFAKLFGKEKALGKKIRRGDESYEVVGIVKDYMFGNMYEKESGPVLFFNYKDAAKFAYIRTKKTANVTTALASIEGVFKTHDSSHPFNYKFLDDSFNKMFQSEQLIGTLSQLFAMLAIFISCLGLFGLAAYTAERRSKEIGVRKVLGATVSNIVHLLSTDFLKLVMISIVIATPIAWYLMHNWLQDFAYRISINWWVFILAGIAAISIALITVSFQAIKTAIANPVNSLRTE